MKALSFIFLLFCMAVVIQAQDAEQMQDTVQAEAAEQTQAVALSQAETQTQDADAGKVLFRTNCAACHAVDQNLVGPALKGVAERRDKEWLYSFIKGSQEMVNNGDETAVALFNQYNKIPMPNQNLTDEEIDNILAYVAASGQKETAGSPIVRPVAHWENNGSVPMRFSDFMFWIPFTLSVIFLLIIFYYMTIVAENKFKDIAVVE